MSKDLFNLLEEKIQEAYSEHITMDQAEKLAGQFLHAQLIVNKELSTLGLEARMRKSGLKGVRGAIYLEESRKGEKKPTEATLTALLDTHDLVSSEQNRLDEAENKVEELERYYSIFQNAHIFFRTLARGSFNS
jgi:hypothetical protein